MTDTLPHPAAQKLIGVPFKKGGRSSIGTDCLGISLMFLAELGVPIVDPWSAEQTARWNEGELDAPPNDAGPFQPGEGRWERAAVPLEVGDLVVTHGDTHVMPYVGGGYVLVSALDSLSCLRRLRLAPTDTVWRWSPC